MFRFSIYCLTVAEEKSADFEAEVRKQVDIVREREVGSLLYAFFRRPGSASTLLPAVPDDYVQFISVEAFLDEGAEQSHLKQRKTLRPFLAAPPIAEHYEMKDIFASLSRDHKWGPEIFRFDFRRFKIPEGRRDELEVEARKWKATVKRAELGTVLDVFGWRSEEGSSMLPKSPFAAPHPEFLHMKAYKDEAAFKAHGLNEMHPTGTGEWNWAKTRIALLEAPMESEILDAGTCIAGMSRAADWDESLARAHR